MFVCKLQLRISTPRYEAREPAVYTCESVANGGKKWYAIHLTKRRTVVCSSRSHKYRNRLQTNGVIGEHKYLIYVAGSPHYSSRGGTNSEYSIGLKPQGLKNLRGFFYTYPKKFLDKILQNPYNKGYKEDRYDCKNHRIS